MKARHLPLLSLLVLIGCDADAPTPPRLPGDSAAYHQPTAPESLLANLQTAYKRRNIGHYATLLAPEFVFQFQPVDANQIGTNFWTRDQDSVGTRALLVTTEVSDIR